MPGTAAVHGLDFFYESEIDYQQTFCLSPSIKLSGPNSAICIFFFFLLAGFFFVVVVFGEQKETLFMHSYSSFNKYFFQASHSRHRGRLINDEFQADELPALLGLLFREAYLIGCEGRKEMGD